MSLQRPINDEERQDAEEIRLAFNVHCQELHNADFEACDNLRCAAAWALEQSYETAGKGWTADG